MKTEDSIRDLITSMNKPGDKPGLFSENRCAILCKWQYSRRVFMKIIDISQEIFNCEVYPGDEKPERRMTDRIDEGRMYNCTSFSMCAHNGTHVDAPYHFYDNGKTIDQLNLDAVIGRCYVCHENGEVDGKKIRRILEKAESVDREAARRILIGGDMFINTEAAEVLAERKILLIGNESQSVGPMNAPAAVHYALLKEEVVLLEGIRLNSIEEGVYWLNAAPVNLGGSDGAPCRAILIKE